MASKREQRFADSEREGLRPGDLVYVSYTGKIGTFKNVTNLGYWVVKFKKHEILFDKEFIRRPTEAEVNWYKAEIAAEEWLKKRQEELKDLKFKCHVGTLWPEEVQVLREAGYFVYDLRNWDTGSGYNIEIHVTINNIGHMVTDTDLKPFMNDHSWIGIDELDKAQMDDLFFDIKDLLEKGKKLHDENKQAAN